MIPSQARQHNGDASPLLAQSDAGSHDDLSELLANRDEAELLDATIAADGEERVTCFVWLLVGAAAIGGLLFGYDTGVISGALVSIGGDLGPPQLSAFQKELITSATTLGALVGGFVAGIFSDYVGRKPVLVLADLTFIGGALGQSFSASLTPMVLSRLLVGLGVGLAACIVPLYIGELAPARQRGRLVTVNVIAITAGQVIAYGVGAAFESVRGGWRWMVGLGAVPGIVQLVGLVYLPESPRILIRMDKVPQARQVLASVYSDATASQVDKKFDALCLSVKHSIEISKRESLYSRMRSMIVVPELRRALIVACGLQAFQQLSGFNTLMYYSASLFKSVGFDQPTAVGTIIAGTNFGFTLVALKWIDRVGRRRIMLWSSPGMVVGLMSAAVGFYFMTRKTGGRLIDGTHYSTSWSIVILISMIVYVASYATGLGNVPWQQGELFGLEVRGIGTSLATATNWAGNLLIGATYLSLMDAITPAGAFGLYAFICVLGWLFVWRCYPETAGLSLEEVQGVFKEDFGIREAERLRRAKEVRRRTRISAEM